MNLNVRLPKFQIQQDLKHCNNIEKFPKMMSLDEELTALCHRQSLSDLDLRVRFLICAMMEDLLQGVLPDVRVLPYGSCLNGFGWWGSDLDMMVCLNKDPYNRTDVISNQRTENSSFKFLTEKLHSDRSLAQRTLTLVGAMLDLSPKITNVYKILNARVPIVTFRHSLFNNLECDISLEAIDRPTGPAPPDGGQTMGEEPSADVRGSTDKGHHAGPDHSSSLLPPDAKPSSPAHLVAAAGPVRSTRREIHY